MTLRYPAGFMLAAFLLLHVPSPAFPADAGARDNHHLEIEVGPAWQARNDFAIPGDTGTRVSLPDEGPVPAARATYVWDFGERWSARFLAAPLSIDTDFTSDGPIQFQESVFPAGEPLTTHYEFNSYRFTFFYRFRTEGRWSFRGGFTGKVRDARIHLSGAGLSETKDDLGIVPLLYGGARYETGGILALDLEIDALGSPQGRAVDFSARLEFQAAERVRPYVGYRLLDGGADNDEVYTFARFHYGLAGVSLRF